MPKPITYRSYLENKRRTNNSKKKQDVSELQERKGTKANTIASSETPEKKPKRRFKPGVVTVREIKYYQKLTGNLVPLAPLERYVRRKMADYEKDFAASISDACDHRLSGECLEIIAEALNGYIL